MATMPLPRNTAIEKVLPSRSPSKPRCVRTDHQRVRRLSLHHHSGSLQRLDFLASFTPPTPSFLPQPEHRHRHGSQHQWLPHLEVLGDQPGLKCGEEQRRRNTAEDAANKQDAEVVEVLCGAAEHVAGHVCQRRLLAAPVGVQQHGVSSATQGFQHVELSLLSSFQTQLIPQAVLCAVRRKQHPTGRDVRLVGKGADDGAKHHGGSKASNEEPPNVSAIEAIVLVQGVHVRPLQPVSGCADSSVS